jgi:hypothetical protein
MEIEVFVSITQEAEPGYAVGNTEKIVCHNVSVIRIKRPGGHRKETGSLLQAAGFEENPG